MLQTKDVLKYRSIWMGLAIWGTVLHHMNMDGAPLLIQALRGYGNIGTYIFIFCTGIGSWYSLSRDDDSLRFFGRKAKRIFPMYWCHCLFWLTYEVIRNGISWRDILGALFGIQYLTEREFPGNWYMAGLLLCYALAPYFFRWLKREDRISRYVLFTLFLILLSVPFWYSRRYIIVVVHFPILFMGMALAKITQERGHISPKGKRLALLMLIPGFILLVLFYLLCKSDFNQLRLLGLWWYPYILLTPGLCLLFSLIASHGEKSAFGRTVNRFFDFVGKHTFELFLADGFAAEIFPLFVYRLHWFPDSPLGHMFQIVPTIISAFLLNRFTALVTKVIVPALLRKKSVETA